MVAEAPKLVDRLDPDDAEHFRAVLALLDAAGAPYEIDPTLVRGLDYYTRTVFEFESERLGAQAALGGGGRYDGLVEQLGGPPTPGVGFAARRGAHPARLDGRGPGRRGRRVRRARLGRAARTRSCCCSGCVPPACGRRWSRPAAA